MYHFASAQTPITLTDIENSCILSWSLSVLQGEAHEILEYINQKNRKENNCDQGKTLLF